MLMIPGQCFRHVQVPKLGRIMVLIGFTPPALKAMKRCVSNTKTHHKQKATAISPTPLANCSGAGREITALMTRTAWNQKGKHCRSPLAGHEWDPRGLPGPAPGQMNKAPDRQQAESKRQATKEQHLQWEWAGPSWAAPSGTSPH